MIIDEFPFFFLFFSFSFLLEKLWKRICSETATEIKLLAENWKYILGGLIFQVCLYLTINSLTTKNHEVFAQICCLQ